MRQIRELKQALGTSAYCPRRAIQSEFVPLLLDKLYRLLTRDKTDEAIDFLDSLNITNDMMKEHMMDLCSNVNVKS